MSSQMDDHFTPRSRNPRSGEFCGRGGGLRKKSKKSITQDEVLLFSGLEREYLQMKMIQKYV